MKPALGAVTLMLLTHLPLSAGEKLDGYRYWKPLKNQPSSQEEILAVTLDSDIYAATQSGFGDLRIIDAKGAEAPYQLELATGRKTETVRHTTLSDVQSLKEEGSAIEILIRLRKDSPPADGLTFHVPMTNFERTVRVFGSEDGQKWTESVAEALIFDYTRYMDVQNTDVALPENKYRQLRVLVEDVVEEKESPFRELTKTLQRGEETQRVERTTIERRALRIDQITLWREVAVERERIHRTADYPVERFTQSVDAERKETVIHIIARRQPLTRFTLQTSSRNFARNARVEVPVRDGPRTRWDTVGQESVFNFAFRKFRREDLSISFPEQRQVEYRVVIQNEDNPALQIDGVHATGNVYRTVFLAEPEQAYRVFYDNEHAEAPNYEASTVLGALRGNYAAVTVDLGNQTDNPRYRANADASWLKLLNRPWFLVAAVCIVVAVLGWGLFQAARRLPATALEDSLPSEPGDA
jgi:DNA-dependent RNA polymerase auxiliary subunit epsilon